MRGSRIALYVFLAFAAVVVAGIAGLPGLNAAYGTGSQGGVVPVELAALELAWMFALWACLIAIMVFLILWVAENLPSAPAAAGSDERALRPVASSANGRAVQTEADAKPQTMPAGRRTAA